MLTRSDSGIFCFQKLNFGNQESEQFFKGQEFRTFIIHVFPAEAGIQNNSAFLLDPGLRRGDDEYQNAKVLRDSTSFFMGAYVSQKRSFV
jgi:hypothetical protein